MCKKKIINFFVVCVAIIMLSTFSMIKKSYALESTYKGFDVAGNIEISKISINLPIMQECTVSSLNISVAFFGGAGINQIGNSNIVGHNYGNGMFFSNLYQLEIGDYIKITDMTDTIINYKVYKTEIITDDKITSFYQRDTNGKREITLSTSTLDEDTASRLVVLAVETTDNIDEANNNASNNNTDNNTNDNNINNSVNNNMSNNDINNNTNGDISDNNINNNANYNNTINNNIRNNTINNGNTSISQKILPKTGKFSIVIFVFIISISSIISFIKFRKYNKL